MKKFICSIIAIMAFLVIVSGPVSAGPIDWTLNKLGIVKSDELDEVRRDLSQTRHELTETKTDLTKLGNRLEEVEVATWTLWGVVVITFYAIIGILIICILYRLWVKAHCWYQGYKSRKQHKEDDYIE